MAACWWSNLAWLNSCRAMALRAAADGSSTTSGLAVVGVLGFAVVVVVAGSGFDGPVVVVVGLAVVVVLGRTVVVVVMMTGTRLAVVVVCDGNGLEAATVGSTRASGKAVTGGVNGTPPGGAGAAEAMGVGLLCTIGVNCRAVTGGCVSAAVSF